MPGGRKGGIHRWGSAVKRKEKAMPRAAVRSWEVLLQECLFVHAHCLRSVRDDTKCTMWKGGLDSY